MKMAYKKPMVRMVDFCYNDQVTADSTRYCDQGWSLMTTLDPRFNDGAEACKRCDSDLIWLNELAPWD